MHDPSRGRERVRRVGEEEMRSRLATLREAHRDLDAAADALAARESPDQLQFARLKRQKLRLRDEIVWLEKELVPDIIA